MRFYNPRSFAFLVWGGLMLLVMPPAHASGTSTSVSASGSESSIEDGSGRILIAASRTSRRRSSSSSGYGSNSSNYNTYNRTGANTNQYSDSSSRSSRRSRSNYDDAFGDSDDSRRSRRSRRSTDEEENQLSERDQRNTSDTDDNKKTSPTSRSGKSSGPSNTKRTSGGSEEIEVSGPTAKTDTGKAANKRDKKSEPPKVLATKPQIYIQASTNPVLLDEEFDLDFRFQNPKNKGYDRFEFTLKYDPEYFEFISSSTDSETLQIADQAIDKKPTIREVNSGSLSYYVNEVFPATGTIHYLLELSDESSTASGLVATARFRGIKQCRPMEFEFISELQDPDGLPNGLRKSGVTLDGVDILGNVENPTDGLLSQRVGVKTEQEREISDRTLAQDENVEKSFNTNLRLWTPRRQIVLGEEFDVYVDLENPDADIFDQISLLIAFNPRVLAVVDYDDNNAITQGVNIHDGTYRETFPFDYSNVNKVDQERGVIDYRMRAYRKGLRAEGTLAAIRFRALQTTTKTTLRLLVDLESEEPTSGLFYRFEDVLGDSQDPADGLATTSIQIGRIRTASALAP